MKYLKLQNDLKKYGLNPNDWYLQHLSKNKIEIINFEMPDLKLNAKIKIRKNKLFLNDLEFCYL